jgi:hypothetical protein
MTGSADAWGAAACPGRGAVSIDPLIGTSPGPVQASGALTVVPLIANAWPRADGGPRYLSLSQALAAGRLTVAELGQGGSVPDLMVVNRGDTRVLILDGEELVGAKQNRVLNASMLVERFTEMVVPVSCTERGRWHAVSARFADSEVVAARNVRMTVRRDVEQSLRAGAGHRADQGAVWNEVDDLQRRHRSPPPTSAMRDVFAAREPRLHELLRGFPLVPGQCGLLVLCDGEAIGMDRVSRPEAYAHLHGKLLRSYALDALRATDGRRCAPEAVAGFARALREARGDRFRSPGLGWDVRFCGRGLVGSALVFRGWVLHAAAFATDDGKMSRTGTRRDHLPS